MFLRFSSISLVLVTSLISFEPFLYAAGNSGKEEEEISENQTRTSQLPNLSHKEQPTPQDCEIFNHLNKLGNPLLTTNDQYDKAQESLNSPLIAEISLKSYLQLKFPEEDPGANSTIFIGYLANGTKVLIKRPIWSEEYQKITRLDLEEALSEQTAPSLARAFFDQPTLPPTELLYRTPLDYELRQYFIDGVLEDDGKAWKKFFSDPSAFGRSYGFLFNLVLFNRLIGAGDRNNSNYLFVPSEEDPQRGSFYAIDYAETNYKEIFSEKPEELLTEKVLEDTFFDVQDIPEKFVELLKTHSSPIYNQKAWELVASYEKHFDEAKKLAPDVYNPTFFEKMRKWQVALLNHYNIPQEDKN